MPRPQSSTESERIYFGQKMRLNYLLKHYAPPSLTGVELYRRLRLIDAFDENAESDKSEARYRKKLVDDGKRWLSDTDRVRATVGQFSQWIMLDGPNYRP